MDASEWFRKISSKTSKIVGQPLTFVVACVMIIIWAGTGPIFHYSDTWGQVHGLIAHES